MSHSTSANAGRGSCTRPHSKTTVVGPSVKTRLQCNHLKPKCKCSNIVNQKRSHKTKHTVTGTSGQRQVLSSSRALPRGETNGRKTYHCTDDSVSVCDATWRPNLTSYSDDRPTTNTENRKHRDRDGKVIKKKLRFEDQVTKFERRHNRDQATDSGKDASKRRDGGQHLPPCTARSSPRSNTGSGPERNIKEMSRDYCRLCEGAEKGYSYDSYRKRRKDEVLPDATRETTAKLSPDSDDVSSKENHEICFLCHQNTHHCRGCDNYCRVCDRYLYSHGSREHLAEDCQAENRRHPPTRHVSGDEVGQSSSSGIPYRPRTTFVKDLKQKLETTYRKEESVHKEMDVGTREPSGGTDSNRIPQRHHSGRHHMHPGKKCLHRYQQNDRLFLEPTLTDREGRSLCSECGAAQPKNPERDPYVYHITLGDMKPSHERTHGASRGHSSHKGKENGAASLSKSRKKSSDASKHIYAKLNDSIDDIFWNKGVHSTFSTSSPQTKVLRSLHSKRHPSRSMALVDYLV
ncbi:uncharacterized protein LOC127001307 [Eriocheir sinensis]|uniref:uncharacterized protein LOC127001307 n=1 Tax=Eriocheir sinensis TaxID=95602 RepID=UPI0021C75368|nr:uncharacterized protein LOC127001307 [Eriocheir sinensis]XP_050721685.1 uncharacterized protein LOC127001307 [Eriocheir sinensis]XP_050721686.1 uncharacterized protein LOC127001307 [Eriocheir sinensis]XP_050721687.1 uncharacterized protein LOC127001307 [Eriocheir sinensis]XP_050721688.1 uncharacterized protein LOC127001307 [Eriocheir sinensis]XP_050721689.1 uncharacterized protein LOC127001307 [Eriocheir sinensis]XP_050721690.1 uncharacterized protein LOC127001307 [Eriocheir sinensis]XP_0